MTTLAELLKVPTQDEVLDKLIGFLRMLGFPVASWEPFSLPRQLTDSFAYYLQDLHQAIASIASGGLNRLASGAWLDLLSENFYGNTRLAAVRTTGLVTFTDSSGVGPITKAANTVWIELGGQRFVNVDPFTVPLNGAVSKIAVQAESAGAAWNVPNGAPGALVTSLAGVSVSNPDPGDNNGTWITTQGRDAESDPALQQRNEDRWSILGSGANEAAYRYWCTTLGAARISVVENQPASSVQVSLAGTAGPLDTPTAGAIELFLLANVRPLGSVLSVAQAIALSVPIAGTYYVSPDLTLETAAARVSAAVASLFASIDVGGVVYRSAIIAAIKSVPGIYNVVLSSPSVDTTTLSFQVAIPDTTLLLGAR